ncbi:amidohydrolase family protein [Bradyrhizobium sp. JYMT SZCCT0180]|uniref:amidohydrolase family protein n=1 Tax=Bradyrhizobium sp. JYMT SZCCT0180 TaxID=2807666 RepID=UPI001BA641EE|nr:amidohydrolase family protein [Bradyrhizobium sp. JYMT SZCCT0180]MBR1211580.1 amidohydrolase [Bradyrhizobium sp. JYMT SZCCT0180]
MVGNRQADLSQATRYAGAIDCDLHPAVPGMSALMPYLDDYWREMVSVRALDRLNLNLTSYPQNAPLSCRPDWTLDQGRKPGSSLEAMQAHVLNSCQSRYGILNCLYGAQVFHSEDMAAAFCRATNDWLRDEWLNRDSRLRASITIAAHNTELAVAEIERRADDFRFVQVLMLVSGEMTLGRRQLWPIYQLAERLGLAIGIHAGSAYRYAPTAAGWPSYYVEDYIAQSCAFESQLQSMISEGVFAKFPNLKVVAIESGLTWLSGFVWRADKTWKGLRAEVPWVTRAPSEIIRNHVRFTVQPIDAADEREAILRLTDHLKSDKLFLFSTDYPHWQFDGDVALPDGLPDPLFRNILSENALATYPRMAKADHALEVAE